MWKRWHHHWEKCLVHRVEWSLLRTECIWYHAIITMQYQWYCTIQNHTIPYHTMQYHMIMCHTMQYHTIQLNTIEWWLFQRCRIPCLIGLDCSMRGHLKKTHDILFSHNIFHIVSNHHIFSYIPVYFPQSLRDRVWLGCSWRDICKNSKITCSKKNCSKRENL